jgi:uncharacterized protein
MKRDDVLAIVATDREQLQKMGVKSLNLFGSVARDEAHAECSDPHQHRSRFSSD